MITCDRVIAGLLITLLITLYLISKKKEMFTNRADMIKKYLSSLHKFPSYTEYKRVIKDGDMVEWSELRDLGLNVSINTLSKFIM
jgi:hypothetical protein